MKHQVLKIGFLATALVLLSVGLNAQLAYTSFTLTGPESVDSVSVGSRMPYKTNAQDAVAGLTFEYKWLFTPASPILNLAGTTATEKGSASNYFDENEISVLMPSSAGAVTLTTAVRSLFNGTVLCASEDSIYNIRVVPLPSITWTAADHAGCATAAAVTVPVTLTNGLIGQPQYEVTYTLSYYTAFDKTGTPVTTTGNTIAPTGSDLVFPAATFNQGLGVYEITVTNITDRISRKSLDALTATTLPTGVQNVYLFPVPVANPVQHIRNMP